MSKTTTWQGLGARKGFTHMAACPGRSLKLSIAEFRLVEVLQTTVGRDCMIQVGLSFCKSCAKFGRISLQCEKYKIIDNSA